jgi:CheY-like chemotaxis protein
LRRPDWQFLNLLLKPAPYSALPEVGKAEIYKFQHSFQEEIDLEVSTLHPQEETLLIVDDEPLMTDLFLQYMSRQGYRVLVAASGQEALDIVSVEGDTIRLIVMDKTMPEMDGVEAARVLSESAPTIPVLIASGHDAGISENTLPNIVGIVQKPYQNRVLAERIRQILNTQR